MENSLLKAARFVSNMTQQELFLESGVHASRISLFERGLAQPTPNERQRIEAVLGMKIWPQRTIQPEEQYTHE